MKKRYFFIILLIFSINNLLGQENITDNEKKIFLNKHNFFREIVAANKLIWSDELAAKAKSEVLKIAKKPNSIHPVSAYGSNIYKNTAKITPSKIVEYWAAEQRYYHGEILSADNVKYFGHYTQIIWSKTTSIGCAMAKTKGNTYIWLCLYAVKGNTIGQKPYQ